MPSVFVESSQHALYNGMTLSGFIWVQRWWAFPMRHLSLCFLAIPVNLCVITCTKPYKENVVLRSFPNRSSTATILLLHAFNSWGINFAAHCSMFRSTVKKLWHFPNEISNSLASFGAEAYLFSWIGSLILAIILYILLIHIPNVQHCPQMFLHF